VSDWYGRAACKGTGDEMFPSPETKGPKVLRAKRRCKDCPVQPECLADALDYDTKRGRSDVLFGIRGGLGTRERAAHRLDGAPIGVCTRCELLFVSAVGALVCGACTPTRAAKRAEREIRAERLAAIARELAATPVSTAGRYLRQARAERREVAA